MQFGEWMAASRAGNDNFKTPELFLTALVNLPLGYSPATWRLSAQFRSPMPDIGACVFSAKNSSHAIDGHAFRM
jgi:hypothetical protein